MPNSKAFKHHNKRHNEDEPVVLLVQGTGSLKDCDRRTAGLRDRGTSGPRDPWTTGPPDHRTIGRSKVTDMTKIKDRAVHPKKLTLSEVGRMLRYSGEIVFRVRVVRDVREQMCA